MGLNSQVLETKLPDKGFVISRPLSNTGQTSINLDIGIRMYTTSDFATENGNTEAKGLIDISGTKSAITIEGTTLTTSSDLDAISLSDNSLVDVSRLAFRMAFASAFQTVARDNWMRLVFSSTTFAVLNADILIFQLVEKVDRTILKETSTQVGENATVLDTLKNRSEGNAAFFAIF